MPEEAGYDLGGSGAFVVVGALCVGEADGAGGFDALVCEEGAGGAEVEGGFGGVGWGDDGWEGGYRGGVAAFMLIV